MPPTVLLFAGVGEIAPGVVCEALPKAKAFAGLESAPDVCPAMGVPPKRLGLASPPATAPEANAVKGGASMYRLSAV